MGSEKNFTQKEVDEKRKEHIMYICQYLTGKITKEDFIGEFKRQTHSHDHYGMGISFTECVTDILSSGGKRVMIHTNNDIDLQTFARENNFDTELSLKLRNVDENVCANKLTDALIDIAYSPISESNNKFYMDDRYSSFNGYIINTGYPAYRAAHSLIKSSHYTDDIIKKKLGSNRYSPTCVYEAVRKDLGRIQRVTEQINKCLHDKKVSNR